MGAKRSELIAALMTSIVEAGGSNPAGGDRDSVGWRQERGHYGSVAERMNVDLTGRTTRSSRRAGRIRPRPKRPRRCSGRRTRGGTTPCAPGGAAAQRLGRQGGGGSGSAGGVTGRLRKPGYQAGTTKVDYGSLITDSLLEGTPARALEDITEKEASGRVRRPPRRS